MDTAELARYIGILAGNHGSDPGYYLAGWNAHEAGKPFGDGPRPLHCVAALSWRIGWNDRALGKKVVPPSSVTWAYLH